MKSLRLTWFHLKRIILKNWGFVIISLGFPLVMIIFFLFVMDADSSIMTNQNNAVLNHSEYVSEEVQPQLADSYGDDFLDDAEEAFHQLDQIEATMLYEIPEGFPYSEETIQVYSLNGNNRDPIFEAEFTNALTNAMTMDIYEEANINFETTAVPEPKVTTPTVGLNENMSFVVFMILFFMGYTTGFVAGDLAKMRKEGLLTRSIISNTYSWQILGSVLGAYTIYSVSASLMIAFITSLLFGITITNFALILSLILAVAVFVAGLTMVLFRVFKNETLIQMLGMMLMMVLVFVPLFFQGGGDFSFIQYISPYYWVFEAIDTAQILPHAPIIALYGLVLFTAGSFKIERLVKDR